MDSHQLETPGVGLHAYPRSSCVSAQLVHFGQTDSTNIQIAKAFQLDPQLASFTTMVADYQTAGRGRGSHTWSCARGDGLLASVLLRFNWSAVIATHNCQPAVKISSGQISSVPVQTGFVPVAAAVPELPVPPGYVTLSMGAALRDVVADFLEHFAPHLPSPYLKWPNDVYLNGKKLGGVLVEVTKSPEAGYALIVGAGLNIFGCPSGLPAPGAISLREAGFEPAVDSADRLLAAFLTRLRADWPRLLANPQSFWQRNVQPSFAQNCLTIGHKVLATTANGQEITGMAEKINSRGELVLNVDGEKVSLPVADTRLLEVSDGQQMLLQREKE